MNTDRIPTLYKIIFSALYSILVIYICTCFEPQFFIIDDAINEMLGSFTQYGKRWSSGLVPLIVESMYLGGNSVIELDRGLFLPQNIIASILVYKTHNLQLTSLFMAFCNLFLITLSATTIAEHFRLSRPYTLLFAVFVAINPVFLYQYAPGWWNAANGQAWATAAIATFLLAKTRLSPIALLLHFLSVCCLLASGWPHGVIGYATFALLILITEGFKAESRLGNGMVVLVNILALLMAVPIYSEYLYSATMIERVSEIHNIDNFLRPTLSSIVFGFNPTFYDFIHYFNGYRLLSIPVGFSVIFLPLALCFRDGKTLWQKDSTTQLLAAMLLCYFLLTQMPSQFGPLRWPFRLLPFLSMATGLLVCHVLDKGNPVRHFQPYLLTILVSFLIALFTSVGFKEHLPYVQLSCLLLFLILPFVFDFLEKRQPYLLLTFPVVVLLVMLSGQPTLGREYVSFTTPPERIAINPRINLDGHMLSLTGIFDDANRLDKLMSAQFGFYDIKSVNGYVPVGNIYLQKVFPYHSTHGLFEAEPSLDHILHTRQYGACLARLMQISTISMEKTQFKKYKSALLACGYRETIFVEDERVFVSMPFAETATWKHHQPFVFPADIAIETVRHTNNKDLIKLPAHDDREIVLIFPRVWWHGYYAKINGIYLPVEQDDSGVLTKVTVPPMGEGILKLNYFPYTWRFVWWCPLLALLGMSLIGAGAKKWRGKKRLFAS